MGEGRESEQEKFIAWGPVGGRAFEVSYGVLAQRTPPLRFKLEMLKALRAGGSKVDAS